jgi:plasmid stabilization system protein ParE
MKLEVLREAEDEAARETDFNEGEEIGLGRAFIDDLQRTLRLITEGPLHFQQLRKRANLRMALFDRFPFKVIYEVEPDLVRVIAICHQKRRPQYWRSRS